jgi:hypothetical protein
MAIGTGLGSPSRRNALADEWQEHVYSSRAAGEKADMVGLHQGG